MGPFATTLAVLLAGAGTASSTVFSLKESYDASNFFEKFDFFEASLFSSASKFGTGNPNDHDPSKGFVNYKSRSAAFASGLVKYQGDGVYIGVDSVNKWWEPDGRPSIRLESKKDYTKGLFIARFSHLPKRACGAWPAFWTYSKVGTWPNGGEVDMYENWNLATQNHPTFHTGDVDAVGRCVINTSGSTGSLLRADCAHDNTNTGCNVADTNGPWASPDGGIYAMEWTDSYIRVFTWSHAAAPSNIDSKHPDTAAWGKPVIEVRDGPCNIKRQFGPQKLVLNIDFCGDAAGNPGLWNQECGVVTGESECYQYVRNNPEQYKDVYWKVKDIRYFEEGFQPDPTSSTTSSTSTTTSTSSTTSSTLTSSTTSTTSTTSPTSSTTSTSSTTTISSTTSSTVPPTTSSTTSTTSSTTSSTSPTSSSSSTSSVSSSITSSSSSSISSTSSSSSSATTSLSTGSTTDGSSSSSSLTTISSPTITTGATTSSVSTASSSTLTSASSSSTSATTSSSDNLTSSSQVSTSSSVPVSSSSSSLTSSVPVSFSSSSSSSSSSTSGSTSSSSPIDSGSSSSATSTSVPTGGSSSSAQPTGTSVPSSSGSSTSSALPGTATGTSAPVTASFTTTTYSITSCAPTVTNCPKGHIVTETIPLYTTVCPVTATAAATPSPSGTAPGQPETITTKITKVYTITSCAPTVTNCPIGKVTTEVVTSTVSPSSNSGTSKPTQSTSDMGCRGGNCATGARLIEQATSIVAPSSVPTAASSIQQLLSTGVPTVSTGVSTGVPSVATSASHAASTGIVPSGTRKPTGTQTQPPVAALANPSKSVSKALTLVAGMLVAALLL